MTWHSVRALFALALCSRSHIDIEPYNHIISHIVKTTLDLDDALLMEAKSVAARRRTTLKAIVEHALRRELAPAPEMANPDPENLEMGPLGFLVLKRKAGETLTLEQIRTIQDEIDDEELQRAIHPRQA